MAILVKTQSEKRLIDEIYMLAKENLDCYYMMKDLADFVKNKYDMDIVLTHIFRTMDQQWKFYGKDTKKVSPHQLLHAFDVRSHGFTSDEIKEIETYINNKYNKKNYYRWTCKCHEVIKDGKSFGKHFHFQYCGK